MTNLAPCDMQALSFHDRGRGVRMTGVMQPRTLGCDPGPQFTDVVLDPADAEQSGPCRRGTAQHRHGGRTGTPGRADARARCALRGGAGSRKVVDRVLDTDRGMHGFYAIGKPLEPIAASPCLTRIQGRQRQELVRCMEPTEENGEKVPAPSASGRPSKAGWRAQQSGGLPQ